MTVNVTLNKQIVKEKDFKASQPSLELLSEFSDLNAWKEAIRQAERSPMFKYGIGAVLIDNKQDILASGCAYPNYNKQQMASTHAEIDCLRKASNLDLRGTSCLIYTLNNTGNGCPWTSKPCLNCAQRLVKRGVKQAIFAVRQLDGSWAVEIDPLKDVIDNKQIISGKKEQIFARCLSRY
jgi:tRNA(Arg) A34 adenosine deaminase TadA